VNKEWDFEEFKKKFREKTSLDLDSYKQRQMERRIRQMITREGCTGFQDFFQWLDTDQEALNKFLTYLTINTSGFFRDEHVYENLKKNVLPELLQKFKDINIWSAGCSNGEEPYTVAIILEELNAHNRASILAGDFDQKALERAREGKYSWRQVEKVPTALLGKCFNKEGDWYYIKDRYKNMVTYRQQDLLKPLHGLQTMHLILCRNVFIYFKTEIQEEVINRFVNLMPLGGYLVIGCAEYISEAHRFGLERKYSAIYRKK